MQLLIVSQKEVSAIKNQTLKTILSKILKYQKTAIHGYYYSDDHSDYNDNK